MSFSDPKQSARMRDVIERIVMGVLRRERPEPRIGKVWSYDKNSKTALVYFAGDTPDTLTKVNVPQNLIPKFFLQDYYTAQGASGPGDIIRVAGKPGNYFVLGYVNGAPEGLPAAGSEPVVPFGTSGQFWDGTKTFRAITVADVSGAAVDANMVHKTGDETVNGVKTFLKPLALTEQGVIPSPISGSGQIYAKTSDGLPYWLSDDGVERPILEVTQAIHADPDFEQTWLTTTRGGSPVSTTRPNGWSDFWATNTVGFYQDSSTKTSGIYSVRVERPSNQNAVLQEFNILSVAPYDQIVVSLWSKGSLASGQKTQAILQTAVTSAGVNFFSADPTYISQVQDFPIGNTWNRYEVTFIVPAGHLFARICWGFGLNIAETTSTFWIDQTGSVLTHSAAGSVGGWAKESVVAVATTNLTLSGTGASPTVDAVSVQQGQRLLCTGQTTPSQNGIYTVNTGSGVAWTRVEDANTSAEVAGAVVSVLGGTVNGGTKWTTNFKVTDTLGTTAQSWYSIVTVDTGWLPFSYPANYQDYGPPTWRGAEYRRVGDRVMLRGLITRNTSTAPANSTAVNLPVGFRPVQGEIFESHISNNRARIDVNSNGDINHQDSPLTVGGYLSLAGIEFSTT